jgi:DNA polymerase I
VTLDLSAYREIWALDFEFNAQGEGDIPVPLCLCAHELRSDRWVRLWRDEMGKAPPYPTDDRTLFISFVASAEMGCHRALGWPIPKNIIDLAVEFRAHTSGLVVTKEGRGLVGACAYFGINCISSAEKDFYHDRIIAGGPLTPEERAAILKYCEQDVAVLSPLLTALWPYIRLPYALLHGEYTGLAQSHMEHTGIPIDVPAWQTCCGLWDQIIDGLIADLDQRYGVFEGRSFREHLFETYLARSRIPWPRLETGHLELTDKVFREMAKAYPAVSSLRELRHMLGKMRLADLAVGSDGRNRTPLWAFGSRTGRNQPSNVKYVFGTSVWLRGFIKPEPGYGLCYRDWAQQEVGIAAVLSGDLALQEAYLSGDVYLAFGKKVGLIPPLATKNDLGIEEIRDALKQCILGIGYGLGARGLALRICKQTPYAQEMLEAHRAAFPRYAEWSDHAIERAVLGYMSGTPLESLLRWPVYINGGKGFAEYGEDGYRANSSRNFPMQSGGSDLLRLACVLAVKAGLEVCAPIHDAILLRAPLHRLEADSERLGEVMAEASRTLLGGFTLRSDKKLIRSPNRYMDVKRGQEMWDAVWRQIAKIEGAECTKMSIGMR